MGYALLGISLFLAFAKPKSKGASLFIMAFMWVLYALNYYTPDGVFYKQIYNNDAFLYSFYYEPAFTALMIVCKVLGMPFQGFQMVAATLYITLIYLAIRKFTSYTAYALALFLVFPHVYFISVMRGGIAGSIVIYSLSYLIDGKNKSVSKFLFGMLIAVMFHYSSIIFFILILARKKLRPSWLIAIFVVALTSLALIRWTDIPYSIVSRITTTDRILGWFRYTDDGDPNLTGFILMVIVVMGNIFLSQMVKRILDSVDLARRDERFNRVSAVTQLICRVDIIMVVIVPLLMESSTFMRVLYQVFVINICLCANAAGMTLHRRNSKAFFVVASVVGFVWSIILMMYFNLPYMNTDGSMITYYNFNNNLVEFLFH